MSDTPEQVKVGFLGFGKMARSIAEGLQKEKRWLTAACDLLPVPSETRSFDSATDLEEWADVVLLCVKPQDMASAVASLHGIRPCLSIAAGLSLDTIRGYFQGKALPLLSRAMPNLGATAGLSTTAIYCEDDALRSLSLDLFRSVGLAFSVDREELMHGVTGLSGSGPAYVFLMIQAMAEAGVREGLPFDNALKMAVQTVLASASLLADSDAHPADWIRRVCSPAGTTIEGLAALEANGFKNAIYEAVHAATERSRQLGEKKS